MTKVSLPAMLLHARSLDIPVDAHPNRMPFTGILTKIGEPSDAAPEGSNGKRIILTMDAAKHALELAARHGINYNTERQFSCPPPLTLQLSLLNPKFHSWPGLSNHELFRVALSQLPPVSLAAHEH